MTMQTISNWGNNLHVNAHVDPYLSSQRTTLARGNGRSYGDACVHDTIIDTRNKRWFIDFDPTTGTLTCMSGVLLKDILEVFAPHGWFLPVVPGTQTITIAGAIASDVHGKNHHNQGCFSECVTCFTLQIAPDTLITCSPTENPEFFHATCGGMGLTGIINTVTLQLMPIPSTTMTHTTIKTRDIEHTMQALLDHHAAPYSVAWLDCITQGPHLGRGLVTYGDFLASSAHEAAPTPIRKAPLQLVNALPQLVTNHVINPVTMKLFNQLYYHKQRQPIHTTTSHYQPFFFPLDTVQGWNRLYGQHGFVQFQCVLPMHHAQDGIANLLHTIAQAGTASCLAVLKHHQARNDNLLSFPIEGFSLALDFKLVHGIPALIHRLIDDTHRYQGRVYLAKDGLQTQAQFDVGYTDNAMAFRQFRQAHQLTSFFASRLSERLAL